MKKLILTVVVSVFALAVSNAGKGEDVTVTGDVKCAHCDLDIKKSCQNAIQTSDKKIYLLDGKVAKKFFDENEDVEKVTATGPTSVDGENTVLEAKKIEVAGG
jgi:hypothetical protein